MKIVFARTPKPKRFKYPPRYYDEEKEYWEERRKELGLSEGGTDFAKKLSRNWKRYKKQDTKRKRKAGGAVLVYLLITAILLYFVFFT